MSNKLPGYSALMQYYLKVSKDGDQVLNELGGSVSKLAVRNACSIRVCYCLNMCGDKIPKKPIGVYGNVKKDSKGNYYICGSRGLEKYLDKVFTPIASKYSKNSFKEKCKGIKGLVFMNVTNWGDAAGHFEMWDGENFARKRGDYIEDKNTKISYVKFWRC